MKNIIITLCSILLLVSCTEEESINLDYPLNDLRVEPTTPSLIYPTNNLVCTNFNLEFDWTTSRTITGGEISYLIEIASDSEFNQILFSSTAEESGSIFTLAQGTSYFWRVKAKDNKGYESPYSSIQSFITEPEATTNIIPAISSTATPATGATVTGNSTTLQWDATDGDNDPLVYDVYFGESNPPQLFAENLSASSLEVTIEASKTYYWRVIAKDSHQGVAISRVWNFETN